MMLKLKLKFLRHSVTNRCCGPVVGALYIAPHHYAGAIYCAPTTLVPIFIASHRIVHHASCIVNREFCIVHCRKY
mgnify:CR=1 FL=1